MDNFSQNPKIGHSVTYSERKRRRARVILRHIATFINSMQTYVPLYFAHFSLVLIMNLFYKFSRDHSYITSACGLRTGWVGSEKGHFYWCSVLYSCWYSVVGGSENVQECADVIYWWIPYEKIRKVWRKSFFPRNYVFPIIFSWSLTMRINQHFAFELCIFSSQYLVAFLTHHYHRTTSRKIIFKFDFSFN